MQNIQTNYLKLIKPISGTLNWGGVVNQNWDKIDLEYGKMRSSIQGIEGRLNEVGTFSFLTSYSDDGAMYEADYLMFHECMILSNGKYYEVILSGDTWDAQLSNVTPDIVNTDNYGSIVIGTLVTTSVDGVDNTNFVKDATTKYGKVFYNNDQLNLAQIADFPDFTAFYIHIPTVYDIDTGIELIPTAIYAFGKEWKGGDILIKSSSMEDNAKVVSIMKFKQSLGGYYEPMSTAEQPNYIMFKKTAASIAHNQIDLFIPRCVANSTETLIQLTPITYGTRTISTSVLPSVIISTQHGDVSCAQNIAYIRFFIGDPNTREQIYVPYNLEQKIVEGETQWVVRVDESILYENNQSYYMSYVILQGTIEALT